MCVIFFFIAALGFLYELLYLAYFPWPSYIIWFLIFAFYWRLLKSKMNTVVKV